MNNTTGCKHSSCYFNTTEKAIIITVAVIVILLGIIGNVSTGIVVMCSKKFRSISNLSTLNLALADLVLCIVVSPILSIHSFYTLGWVFGVFFCKFHFFSQRVSVTAILLNLLVVSTERFLAVCFPFVLRMRKKLFLYAVPLVWIVAIGTSIPDLVFYDIYDYGSLHCLMGLEFNTYKRVHGYFGYGALCILIPIQLITICSLRMKGAALKDTSHVNYIRRRNACYMLLFLMLSCIFCWLPLNICQTVFYEGAVTTTPDVELFNNVGVLLILLYIACPAFHASIFFFLSPKGKRTVKNILKNTKRKGHISSPSTSKTNDSTKRKSFYWPFSGTSIRGGSTLVTRESTF